MALLTQQQKDVITQRIVEELCRRRIPIPANKSQIASVVSTMDSSLEAAEVATLANVSAAQRTWLTANQAIAREMLSAIEAARKENL